VPSASVTIPRCAERASVRIQSRSAGRELPHRGVVWAVVKATDNIGIGQYTHWIHRLLSMERAEMSPRDKVFSFVRVYLVESELVGNKLPILSNKVVRLAWLCLQLAERNATV